MSLVLRYQFNETTATLNTDSSGNSNTLVNAGGVVSATDATYGSVASFDGEDSSYFTLGPAVPIEMQGSSPRTFSFWMNRDANAGTLFEYGNLFDRFRIIASKAGTYVVFVGANGSGQNYIFSVNHTTGVWNHSVITYEGDTLSVYINGVELDTVTVPVLDTSSDALYVGVANSLGTRFEGSLSDFRVYDAVLSAPEISDLYSNGPNPPPLSVTMYTHVADLSWSPVTGANSYTVTLSRDSGPVVTIATTSELSRSVYNLIPGSSYEFNLYTDLDNVTPVDTSTASTLPVDSANVDSLMVRLGNDLTLIDSTSIDDISQFIRLVLSTDEVVHTNLGEALFVENSGTITLSDKNGSVLTPFDVTAGSGQSTSIVLPDGSTNLVSFDETTDEISYSSLNYSVGQQFVMGGLKVSVKEL